MGVEISRLVGLCFGILVTDETRPAFAVFLEKVFTVPAKGACEVALQKDGCDPLCVQVEGMATDSGQECRIAMIDITERKLAEEAISASNKLLQTIINTTPIGVFWKDTELRYLGSNIIFARDAGVAFPDDLIGKDDYQLGWEEQAESYRADDRHVIASGIPKLSYDQLQYTPDGDQIWLRTSKVPLRNDAKETIGVLGIYEDITDRKLAEIARTRLLLRQRAILDNLPMMAWLKDTEGRLEMVNEPYAKACGHSVEECIGKTVLELFPEEIARGYVTDDHEVCSTGRKKLVEESISTLQGTKWQLTYKTPLCDEHGLVVGTTGIAQDITERKLAEAETLALQNQLQHAQKMESVGRLAGGVAHDFNNMLSVILGHAELALMKTDPEHPFHTHLSQIRNATERSADLTRQLLAFARKQTIAPKDLDLNETVTDILKMLQRLIGEDIHLTWRPAANLWQVKMDPSQIDQILANLCINARDAIADVGEITIETGNDTFDELYCAHHAGFVPGKYVRLAVSDNGCGMDRETLTHIFEPFFTTKEISKGTGLGLATVYGAVKQNNGFINVYSEPGSGTTFTIYLPWHAGDGGQERTESVAESAPRGQETILLVEDEPDILELITNLLEMQGYAVLATSVPSDAISLARDHFDEIHLLMSDVIMPGMNGRDLANNLLSFYPNLKRLFMSGYTADVISHRGILGEGLYFIQKPFSMQDLAIKVREVLDSK